MSDAQASTTVPSGSSDQVVHKVKRKLFSQAEFQNRKHIASDLSNLPSNAQGGPRAPGGPLNITLFPLSRTFHPTLRISINPTPTSPKEGTRGCYAMLTLKFPDEVFVDKDELADRWGAPQSVRIFEVGDMRSGWDDEDITQAKGKSGEGGEVNFGVKAWTINPDVIDIERPVRSSSGPYSQSRENDMVKAKKDDRITLSITLPLKKDGMELEIPLHGRYLPPSDKGEKEIVVFGDDKGEGSGEVRGGYLCAMASDPAKIYGRPAPRLPSPSSSPPSTSTLYSHPPDTVKVNDNAKRPEMDGGWEIIESKNGSFACFTAKFESPLQVILPDPPITLTLPTGHPSHQLPVEVITAVVIWLGWGYLAWKVFRAVRRANAVPRPETVRPKTE